jgi:MinD-like ATPase involved in chromosome partitioning or flagellar assembly
VTDIALAVPLADEQRLVADAPRHGHRVVARCAGAEELVAKLPGAGAELVVVSASPQYLTARVVAACDRLGLQLLTVADSAAERRFATSVGVVDALDGPFSWSRTEAVATPPAAAAASAASDWATAPPSDQIDEETRHRHTASVARPSVRGTAIAVWGPDGAPGRTTIAIALAAELAESGATVALADADTRAAAVALALGLLDEAPGFAAACRLAGGGGLDRHQFERISQQHRVGRSELSILTGIGRASRWPELTAERVAGVLSASRDWVDFTIVDVAPSFEHDEELMTDLHAPRRNAATIEVLRSSERVVAVGSADPVGLSRFLRAHAELAEFVDPDRILTVINKVRPGAIGISAAAQVRQTLARFGGIDEPVLVPWDLAAFDAALLSGRTLLDVAPRSAARGAIRELAIQLRPPPTPHPRTRQMRRALAR